MNNIKEILKETKAKLDEKLFELKVLETEKKNILVQFEKANDEERKIIEKEMMESVEKFKKLSEEIENLSIKVKELKKKYC